ncbi:transmembrane 4 L6 family member 1-like isoform X2 [Melanotaenia boesemani]|uniref:transmembrane 4 L6 family member 1-like isoform X2 n=1 Tax=Melanotaenia boesemani TaxID=1250792 RepID=UPI001C0538B5|nr:transmembrane 4 L6 family member 1-like isoform X2 [Melanotaenia boesemani]
MCTGKCTLCIAIALYPLVLLSIICNILLFFPDWDIKYAKKGYLTTEVNYMGGFIGGGLLMFFSIGFAAVGAAGAVYSFIVALLGLFNGPLCKDKSGTWKTPFKDSHDSYLNDYKTWALCEEPTNVVQFNMGLFLALMVTSCLQGLLCASQMINGLFGCLCGTSNEEKD